ncbi:MAG: toprim domain-containing protein [Candidatus Melainabacteria bacterium]|nr:toprim domain-containing protein [Candidatus Melainabacteria bacterium]
MNNETITIKEYLDRKNIGYAEVNGELVTDCLFNGCDDDSRVDERHLYFDKDTSQYHCKKCDARGNIVTLAKHLGDDLQNIFVNQNGNNKQIGEKRRMKKFDESLVEKYNEKIPERIRQYLNDRGISNAFIDHYKLGFNDNDITIPIKDIDGKYIYFKLRQDPAIGTDKMTSHSGIEAQIFDWQTLKSAKEKVVICEGELDKIVLHANGVCAVTSTHGAETFKEEWVKHFSHIKEIYTCYDNDEAGRKGSLRVLKLLSKLSGVKLFNICLPPEVGEKGDITDYFVKLQGTVEDLFTKYAKEYPEKIDTSKFKPITVDEVIETLGLTIKKDESNKIITFLCQLSAYTESSQLNVSFNAPSSTGKSYIPMEIAKLFPEEDVIEVAYCSPTAFFHDRGTYNKETNEILVDLSRKIIVFLDQPNTLLLSHLRPVLSHDKKEVKLKITDKNQKGGNRTKNVILRGYPSVVFCTAGLRIDEQESTRFILLSPEANQEKIREAILEKIKRESNGNTYKDSIDVNPLRQLLKERILAIKQEDIQDIEIFSPELVEQLFFNNKHSLKPRHQRDIGRIISLIKSLALLNLWFRERKNSTIVANEDDIRGGFKIWQRISSSQELNLPPYIYNIYLEIIVPAFKEKSFLFSGTGLSRKELMKQHFDVYKRPLAEYILRQQILPMLESAGLIYQESNPNNLREMLIYLTDVEQRNSEQGGGVNNNNGNPRNKKF